MTDVPSSDWGNGLWLMSANLPERSASYRQRIPRTSRAHRRHIAPNSYPPYARHATQLLPTIHHHATHHMRTICPPFARHATQLLPTICATYAQLLPTIFFTFVQLFSFFTLTITYTPLWTLLSGIINCVNEALLLACLTMLSLINTFSAIALSFFLINTLTVTPTSFTNLKHISLFTTLITSLKLTHFYLNITLIIFILLNKCNNIINIAF